MKIGLITVQRTNNYGALMQAYATQYVLKKHGEVSIIDYRNVLTEDSLSYFRFSPSINGIKSFIKDVFRILPRVRAINSVNSFIENNFNLTESVNSETIKSINFESYDAFVCGSDQIWNPKCISASGEIDANYFLKFATENQLLMSYASSAGAHKYDEIELGHVKKYLSRFNHISVRERELSINLAKHIGRDVAHVLDPTLLLSREEWIQTLLSDYKSDIDVSEKYILVYTVPKTKLLKDAIAFTKKVLGYKVISIDQGLYTSSSVDIQIRDASPVDFLYLFENASFVITDSFHGVCFSINFSKQFMAVSPGVYSNRIDSLLDLTDLRTKSVSSKIEIEAFDFKTYHTESLTLLDKKRNESLNFINKALTT